MPLIKTYLDWETAFGKHPETGENITLSKMTTEEYVRHPLFKVHGLGVKIDQDTPFYLYRPDDLLRFLKTHPWHNTWAICHHSQFDGAILSWRCGVRPKFWGCTLSMARALYPHESSSLANISRLLGAGEKGKELMTVKDKWVLTDEEQRVLGGYCATNGDSDLNLTARIFETMLPKFPVSELRVVDTTVRMFTEPVLRLDPELLQEEIEAEQQRKEDLMAKVAPDRKALMSNDQFAEILLNLGIDPPKKLSPSKVKDGRVNPDDAGEAPVGLLPVFKAIKGMTAEEKTDLKNRKSLYPWAYAMGKNDEEFKLLLDHPSPEIQALVEARMGVKSTINETRAGRMLGISGRGAWPVYLTYCAATTFRYGGGDKVNPQNFTRGSRLRRSIMAPPGHLQAIADLSQIEARMLAVLAGQTDVVEQFAKGVDIYCHDASMIFGVPVTKADKEKRFLGKAVRLGCGYGLGWAKFSNMVRIGMLGNDGVLFGADTADALCLNLDAFTGRYYARAMESRPSNLTENEHLLHCACAKEIIDRYRQANRAITTLWRDAHNIIPALVAEEDWGYKIGREPELRVVPGGIVMPNGLVMQYNGLKQHEGGEWSLTKRRGRRIERNKVYGGLIVENCIAEGTLVLTDSGFKPIENIEKTDKVHDGLDFVEHGGLVYKGKQTCVLVDGVSMTPDHQVLTREGWTDASEITSTRNRLFRPDIRVLDGVKTRRLRQEKNEVGVPLQMWGGSGKSWSRRNQGRKKRTDTQLRLFNKISTEENKNNTRYVEAPSVRGLAVNGRPLSPSFPPSMEKLWWSWNHCVRTMAGVFREFLGGCRPNLPAWIVSGSFGQRWPIFSGEFPVGHLERARQEQTGKQSSERKNRSRMVGDKWHWGHYSALQAGKRVPSNAMAGKTRPQKSLQVVDIINCGPRNRFVVLGDSGPFIVHNCTQSLARIVITDAMNRMTAAGLKLVLQVHDEVVAVAAETEAQSTYDKMIAAMTVVPAWAPSLPLAAEGGIDERYVK